MKARARRALAIAGLAFVGLGATAALAQQPGGLLQPRPIQLPPGHQNMGDMPPGQRPGMPVPPGGRPGKPGQPGRPGFPGTPGHPRRPHAPEPEEPAHEEEECEGPTEPPPRPNWWHGLLMINNERAEKGGFVNELLFRFEDEKNKCNPKNEPPPFLATVINFGLFAFILYRAGKKPLGEALVKRKETIMAEIDTATRLKEEAEARLAEYEEKFENMAHTLDELRREYAEEAQKEKENILRDAEERRARMRRDAEFRIEQELKQARQDLLRDAVKDAVTAAHALLESKMQSNDQDKLADQYLASVGDAVKRGAGLSAQKSDGGAA